MAEGHRERLRNQFALTDFQGMEDHSILELLLSYVILRRETNTIAHALINRFGSLENVLKASVLELQRVDGVGKSTAVFLRSIFMTTQRLIQNTFLDKKGRVRLCTMEEASRYALSLFIDDRYETVRLICLDDNFFVINSAIIAVGDLNSVTVDNRKIVEQALNNSAANLILVHNHPGGIPFPSHEDVLVHRNVQSVCDELKLNVIDYLIVGDSSVYCCRSSSVCFFPNLSVCHTLPSDEFYERSSFEPHSQYDSNELWNNSHHDSD